jgi:Flp pilus assembly protein TadD
MEEKGKHTAALAYFSQAVLLAPSYAKAVLGMGNCLASMGRFEEARMKFQKAAALDPLCARPFSMVTPVSSQPEQGL